MSTSLLNYSYETVDLKSKQRRSTNSMIESGGWLFKQVATYTSSSPLELLDGVPNKLVIPENDTGFSTGKYFDLSYDYTNQKFAPTTVDDVYFAEIRMKVVPQLQAGHLDLKIEVPNFQYNPINGDSITFTKGAGEEHFISRLFPLFIGEEAKQDGIEVMLTAQGTDIDVYDYSFLIVRVYSDKENK